ncbi:phosphoenolpyruvate--protein phosphotransferase [Paludibacterium paludis]|uniref:phosphoenolpyruvate--protein phosphotransferase n=1 Tax=Paludibacterium paludis TaxID=1225769 RepID=A0A918UB44_9NEIS|nr:phosphoenolpyruvate--protein phosphotransferase [Paludibacterium paludis]GGY19898.1 phosphoenolpyruvate--protein phosphotransferase [Paludibacterium paludis]
MSTSAHHRERVLCAPLSGTLVPLAEVPDPVFSEKMLGDGIAIFPAGDRLVAPCDGTVTQIHAAHHALTLSTDEGIDILMHIGLDTVLLKGEGFALLVGQGERVAAGTPLIEFDMDFLKSRARSIVTPVIVLGGGTLAGAGSPGNFVSAGFDPVLRLVPDTASAERDTPAPAAQRAESEPIRVAGPAGLHARPCAVIAAIAKTFASDIRLECRGDSANAKSVVSLMGLSVVFGDTVRLVAEGPDADAAIAALRQPAAGDPHEAAPVATPIAPRPLAGGEPGLLCGFGACAGIAVGQSYRLSAQDVSVAETGSGEEHEHSALAAALTTARLQLDELARTGGADGAGIFAAHQALLEDPDVLDRAQAGIRTGQSAAFAWKQAFTLCADRIAALPNPAQAARADDLRDIGLRVLRILTGTQLSMPDLPEGSILIAEELTPSLTAGLDRTRVAGLCTIGGSPTSHVAILARSLDIPAVVGIDPAALALENGTPVILDGERGTLHAAPDEDALGRAVARRAEQQRMRASAHREAAQEAVTTDGHRVEVVANIGGLDDAEQGLANGAEGVGLLRSEYLFLQRADAPSEEMQAEAYAGIARAVGTDRPLVIRTLDVGGDKPLGYLPMPAEDNPFLGVRGIRLGLARPDILRTQLRAILRAAPVTRLCIMFPMIATLGELRRCKAMVEEERARLGMPPVRIGIMVEVPSAAILAEQFAREADFFSIGTNDLTQYTLAMDRNHPALGNEADALDPAVLHLIRQTVDAAHRHGKWVGVCGGLASDPLAVPLLIGLGVDELSVSVPSIPQIKALVRRHAKSECEALATEVLSLGTAAEVRTRLTKAVKD